MNKEEARVRIDSIINHLEWRHGGGTDYVESDRYQAHQIIDQIELVHPKVKLPREVGEELEDYQNEDIDLLDYLHDVIDSKELRTTRVWMLDDREHRIGILADAYRYGWEAEPEAKWYVQTPKEWWEDKNKPEYVDLDSMGISDGLKCKEYAAQFTRAELKKYHFDSNIFTLFPVEDEK